MTIMMIPFRGNNVQNEKEHIRLNNLRERRGFVELDLKNYVSLNSKNTTEYVKDLSLEMDTNSRNSLT